MGNIYSHPPRRHPWSDADDVVIDDPAPDPEPTDPGEEDDCDHDDA